MSDEYKDKDGVERNLARFKHDWKVFRRHMDKQPDSHAPVTNWCVELCRSAPFLAGHILLAVAIVAVVEAGAIGYLIWEKLQ